jgi:general secretion pathway protein D
MRSPEEEPNHTRHGSRGASALLLALLLALLPAIAFAQGTKLPVTKSASGEEFVHLDFSDVELPALIDTIARLTGKNFIYDDRVRGRVTIVSPSPVTIDQAYAVFESVLKVKGFTAVPGPGGVMKVIPVRDAKEANLETINDSRPSLNRDLFVTRLIPLSYIDAESITNTIKPLVSKDASMVPYPPTNTIIITDTSSNIRRIMTILEAIDIETHREELAVIAIRHADAQTLGEQVAEIYQADVSSTGKRSSSSSRTRRRSSAQAAKDASSSANSASPIRIITDDRTNSLLVLASRSQLGSIRSLIRQLDVPVVGGGRIHVYYLRHADAEELTQTLNALLSGRASTTPGRTGKAGVQPQALRSTISELAQGITVTADAATNSLVIQASREAYDTLLGVIEKLDVPRPQVLVEALIMEVDVADGLNLGFNGSLAYLNGNVNLYANTVSGVLTGGASNFIGLPFADPPTANGLYYDAIINAAARNASSNILSAPHLLTSDNEEAEIRIGDNIPIITSRVDSASGNLAGLSSSVNVERRDIGITLRVTPQISEGDTVRLKIFQEITDINKALTAETGSPEEVGVALSNRQVENTVVVADGETVVIGGLISENYQDSVDKVPWLGDIPFLGWAFKRTEKRLRKTNLLIFLTPHIIRSEEDMEFMTVRKREEFERSSGEMVHRSDVARHADETEPSPIRRHLIHHQRRYPQERMREIELARAEESARIDDNRLAPKTLYSVETTPFENDTLASAALTRLVDAGHDGILVAEDRNGLLHFRIQLGPYDDVEAARQTAYILREAYELDSSIQVLDPGTEK